MKDKEARNQISQLWERLLDEQKQVTQLLTCLEELANHSGFTLEHRKATSDRWTLVKKSPKDKEILRG